MSYEIRSTSLAAILGLVILLSATTAAAQNANAAAGNLITNGSFENAPSPNVVNPGQSWITLAAGSGALAGWTIDSGTIDVHGPGAAWPFSDGVRNVDVSGTGAGSLSQTFATVPGEAYSVLFDLSANNYCGSAVKQLQVTAPGTVETFSVDVTGIPAGQVPFKTKSFVFAATGASSTLKFNSLENSSCGPLVDKVGVYVLEDQAISIKSGSGSLFGPDSSVRMLVGPAETGFNVALTPAQFDAARNGPAAFVIPNHPAWKPHLTVDPSANWIGTHAVNPNTFGPNFALATALYAVDFEITSAAIDSATLDIYLLSDNTIGDSANEGVFINGIPVANTKDVGGAAFGADRSFTNRDITSMVHPGTNTLYVLGADLGGPAGVQFHADIDVVATPPDTTPPVVTGTPDRVPDTNGWYNHAVTVTWTGTDSGSGIASCDPATVYAGPDGSSIVMTGHCTDNAGNVGEGTVTIQYDATAPTITGAPATSPNANNWYNADVTVHFDASDGTSGIATVTPDTTLASEAAGQQVTGTATDNAGNSASFTVSGINIDKTAPAITATQTPLPNANGWNNQDVTATFEAADSLSGVDGANTSTTTFTAEGAGQTASATFTDLAGNSASASVTVNIDKTAPEAYNQFDPATKDVLVYGRDSGSGAPSGPISPSSTAQVRWGDGDKDDDGDNEGNAQLRTYVIADKAGNTLVLKEKVKAEGKQIKVKVVSLQYNGGSVITPVKAKKSFEWSTDKSGAIKELEQKMEVGKGAAKQEVKAKFEAKKNQTTIKTEGSEHKAVLPGMVLLKMATSNGSLVIEY